MHNMYANTSTGEVLHGLEPILWLLALIGIAVLAVVTHTAVMVHNIKVHFTRINPSLPTPLITFSQHNKSDSDSESSHGPLYTSVSSVDVRLIEGPKPASSAQNLQDDSTSQHSYIFMEGAMSPEESNPKKGQGLSVQADGEKRVSLDPGRYHSLAGKHQGDYENHDWTGPYEKVNV